MNTIPNPLPFLEGRELIGQLIHSHITLVDFLFAETAPWIELLSVTMFWLLLYMLIRFFLREVRDGK